MFSEDKTKIYNTIVDVRKLTGGMRDTPRFSAREIYIDLMLERQIGSVAFLASDMIANMVLKMMILKTLKKKKDLVRVFFKEEDAVKWLKSGR